jgi:hypothetical protein
VRSLRLTLYTLCCGAALFAMPARADHRPDTERIDFTAYTLRHSELTLGLGALAYGVSNEITVGTYLPLWLASPLVHAPVTSGYLKLRDWLHGPVSVSLRAAFVHLPASVFSSPLAKSGTTRVGFLVVPLELSVSARLHASFSQSVQVSWVHVGVAGSRARDDRLDAQIGGASAVTSVSLHLLSELRLSRVVALTMRESVLLGSGDLLVHGALERDGTRVSAQLGATQVYHGIVANVVPGIALSWTHVNLHLGIGVGSNWLPFLGLPVRMLTVVPDADFYIRF